MPDKAQPTSDKRHNTTMLKFWKKIPITIRAAYIGGAFVIMSVVLAWLLPPLGNRLGSPKPSPTPEDRARRLIEEYYRTPGIHLDAKDVAWCDLTNTGRDGEFHAKYELGFTDYAVVFTTRNGTPECLLNENSKGACALGLAHVTIVGKTYLLLTSTSGSGHFMTISIYDYDGIGKLRRVHTEEDISGGHIYVVNNRIWVSGRGQRYELRLGPDGFSLVKYTDRLPFRISSGSHVLSAHLAGSQFTLRFDGDPIEFAQSGDAHRTKADIILPMDEEIVFDDNMGDNGGGDIRLLIGTNDWDYHDGFFDSYTPTSPGRKELSISYDGEWYHLGVCVAKE